VFVFCLHDPLRKILLCLLKDTHGDAWVSQSIKHLTLGLGSGLDSGL